MKMRRDHHQSTMRSAFGRLGLIWLLCCVVAGAWLVALAAPARSQSNSAGRYRTKPIEQVQVGDWVLAKDPAEAGPPRACRVTGAFSNYTYHVVHISVRGVEGSGELQATREHPFFSANRGWVDAKDLKEGDKLQDTQGRSVIVSALTIEDRTCDTFNLTVDGLHTFYVLAADQPVLVHNGYGAYTNTHASGKVYVGKGDASRAADSARRIANEYDDPLVKTDWSPAANDTDSFIQEEYRMRAADGPGGNTYNKINSPGNKILRDLEGAGSSGNNIPCP